MSVAELLQVERCKTENDWDKETGRGRVRKRRTAGRRWERMRGRRVGQEGEGGEERGRGGGGEARGGGEEGGMRSRCRRDGREKRVRERWGPSKHQKQ